MEISKAIKGVECGEVVPTTAAFTEQSGSCRNWLDPGASLETTGGSTEY